MCCQVINVKTNKLVFIGHRQGNVYVVYLDNMSSNNVSLMAKKEDESWLWHRRLGHASIRVISKLCQNDLVVRLPKLSFDLNKVCDACVKGKHKKSSYKSKIVFVITVSRHDLEDHKNMESPPIFSVRV